MTTVSRSTLSRAAATGRGGTSLDVDALRADFPILQRTVKGRPLVYLDNAATTQKPRQVIDAIRRFYEETNANVHRAVHTLSEEATAAYEGARAKIQRFVNAAEPREIVFVRGTTEAINLVAHSFTRPRLAPGDEVLISAMEHHSNIVPWQIVAAERGATLRVIPMDRAGNLLLDAYRAALTERTRLVALVHVSNSLGTVNPVAEMIREAKARGIPVLVDGAQAVAHHPVDVQALGCDFYAFSAHKMFGPTGVGALYGRATLLEEMPPFQGGGDMIRTVTFEQTTYAALPHKFEAGTPHIAGAVGFGRAIDYLAGLDRDAVEKHESDVVQYAAERLRAEPGVRLIGDPERRTGVVSFVMDGAHAHDVGTIVDQEGVAIRTGHHCTQPVMDFFGVPATARASFAFYNTRSDVDALVRALARVRKVFGR
ncbi:MAG TPA: cysteine desulfurase [Gemmatimonadales bacterium]|nr:cysteine desulfurase [Gemmatimonadales bacterium]